MSEERQAAPVEAEEKQQPPPKSPSLLRNYLSLAGGAVAAASLTSIVMLFLIELTSGSDNPYLGILTYIILPGFMLFGVVLVLLGMWRERRRRRRTPDAVPTFPVLDLNDPRRRRNFIGLAGVVFVFIFMSAFGSYRAYEHTESVQFCGESCHVMKPELTAFRVAPHANVRCVDCHVGPGPEWYVRSKLSGVRQLYHVTFGTYSRPIKSPVHNMRAATETCAHCHWPDKFHGDEMKEFKHFGYDEANSPRETRMLVHVGGGSPESGPVSGIHWHMNLANEITFVSTDEQRQDIAWVSWKDRAGNVVEYTARDSKLTPEQIAAAPKRRMDCIDCHNRPTHIYQPPDRSVDDSLAAGKLDASLPFIKRESVALLSKSYATTDEAVHSIANGLEAFYRDNYPDVYSGKSDAIRGAVSEVQRIFQTYTFPEMKTDWQTHPNNIGHFYAQGCFRCHDGDHVSNTGLTISKDCRICHTTLDQTEGGVRTQAANGLFRHPVALGTQGEFQCAACHKGNRGFEHPLNLGDISQFQCTDCHAGKVWTTSR
ncbi:MAG TPA: NapC/NirT family cytochrome c [Pyrinomonadaceae bacterium]